MSLPLAQTGLTTVDYLVLLIYLVTVIGLGTYFSRGDKDTEGYLLGGRSMPWWVIGVSYIASLLSTVSMVGAPGEGYKNGMTAVLWPTFGLFLSLGFFFIFIRFYFQTRTFTPFQYLERRFGWQSRATAAGVYCLARGLYLATVLFAAAKVFQGASDWPIPWTIVTIGAVGIVYTTLGGMRAVVWTDFLQFLVLVGGITIVLLKVTASVPGGAVGVFRFAAANDHLFPDFKDPSFFTLNPFVRLTLWAILFRAVADHLFYKSADQILIQRMLATKGYWYAFRSVVMGSVLGPIILFVLYFVGLCMFRHYAELAPEQRPPADLAMFRYITTELPAPVPGLIVAAMLAAIMSTLDSGINSLATVITKDFYLRFVRRDALETAQVRFSRVVTVSAGVVIIAVAVGIAALAASVRGTVLESSGVWMSLLVVLAPVFLVGVTSRRARQWHVLTATAVGVAATAGMTFWYYHTKHRGLEANFFMVAVVPFLGTLITAYGLSGLGRPMGRERLSNLTLWTLESRAVWAALIMVAWGAAEVRAESKQPNIMLISVDDLKPLAGCYGHPVVQTPNIDRLARRGTVFLRAYCQRPLCAPSRQSVLTGLRPETIEVYDLKDRFRETRPNVVTLPQHFKNHGYHAVALGKVFHGGTNDPASWSEPAWWEKYPYHEYVDPDSLAAVQQKRCRRLAAGQAVDDSLWEKVVTLARQKRGSWQAPDVPDELLADGKIATKAIATLHRLRNRPFFLAVGFLKPHLPFVAPKRYFDRYPLKSLTALPGSCWPEGAPQAASIGSVELRGFTDIPPQGSIPKKKHRELVRAYYACVTFVDAQIGRLLDELERLELTENTVVILWGDHGFHLGHNEQWCKDTNFEAAVRAPLIIAAPEQPNPGSRSAGLVEFVDIYPTLCDLAGLTVPTQLEGISFVPLMRQPDRYWKTAAYSHVVRGIHPFGPPEEIVSIGRTMRTKRYRYTEWAKPDGRTFARELYDYHSDSVETVNLAQRPEYTTLVDELSRRLETGWRGELPGRDD